MAKLVIYNKVTGETIKEFPLLFWFSYNEPKIEDRVYNIGTGANIKEIFSNIGNDEDWTILLESKEVEKERIKDNVR